MSITQALANANSGLGAAARRAAVASSNIANALTPGYSRREASLAELAVAGVGQGVRVAGVERAESPALTAERRDADASAARDGARAAAAIRISRSIGGPEDAGSLSARYAAFEAALRTLGDNPQNAAAQQRAAAVARDLAAAVNQQADRLQRSRAEADAAIASGVSSANRALAEIDDLNRAIARGTAGGADVAALEDSRKRAIDEVNRFIPVRELKRGDGAVDLMTPEGVFVIAGSARAIEFSPSPVISAGDAYAGGTGALSGLFIGGVDVTPEGPGAQALKGGEAAGLFGVRDGILPAAARRLDALAEDLIARFAGAGVDPTIPPGGAGLFTDAGGPIVPPAAPGLAGRLALNALVDPAQGGDAARLRDGLGSSGPGPVGDDTLIRNLIGALNASRAAPAGLGAGRSLTAAEAAAHVSSLEGAVRSDAESAAGISGAFAQSLADAELLETGVDTDRELQNLLIVEEAYAANARVIQTASAMIDALLEI